MRISQTGLIFDNPARSTLGYVLVFANGADMGDLHHSQVWEMDLATNEVVWKYTARDDMTSFFSPHMSGAQRLPTGNTLICEVNKGCIF